MPTLKLEFGAGNRPTEGFKSVDIADGADFQVDLFQYPWPWKDRSVQEVLAVHFLEHIPHYRPEWGGVDGFWMFFNELHRILRKNGTATFVVPYFKNDRAFWDPSHTRYISEVNFRYLDRNWLVEQQLDQYPITADFEEVSIVADVPDDFLTWNQERQAEARSKQWNVTGDLRVILKARK